MTRFKYFIRTCIEVLKDLACQLWLDTFGKLDLPKDSEIELDEHEKETYHKRA